MTCNRTPWNDRLRYKSASYYTSSGQAPENHPEIGPSGAVIWGIGLNLA